MLHSTRGGRLFIRTSSFDAFGPECLRQFALQVVQLLLSLTESRQIKDGQLGISVLQYQSPPKVLGHHKL